MMNDEKEAAPAVKGAEGADMPTVPQAASYEIAPSRARPVRARVTGPDVPTAIPAPPDSDILSPTRVADAMEQAVRAAKVSHLPHLSDVIDLGDRPQGEGVQHAAIVEQPVQILIQSLRANAKVFITLRDDQRAAWSEGTGRGLVGFSITNAQASAINMRTFLLNAREMYLQSDKACEETLLQLYVRTSQRDVRGRVDLPPGATVTFQTGVDRTSVVGLSSFALEFFPAG